MTPLKPGKRLCENTETKEFKSKWPFVAASSNSKSKSKWKSKDDSDLISKDKENDLVSVPKEWDMSCVSKSRWGTN